jgi:hypothetical protein
LPADAGDPASPVRHSRDSGLVEPFESAGVSHILTGDRRM